jgi:threonine/homoserine/homoserine lactone efflux protein
VIVFFLSLMPLVVDVQGLDVSTYAVYATTMAAVCSASIFSALYLATQARRVFKSPTALRKINRTSAAMMAGAAVLIGAKN